MSGIKLSEFSGVAPKLSSRVLPNGIGQIADNCYLASGSLKAFADKFLVNSNQLRSGGDIKTVFRMTDGTLDYWLSWIKDVNVVRGQVAGDTSQRIYWTGDNEPRMSNLALAIAGGGVMPASCFVLGVTEPIVAPTVGATGGTGADVSRVYVETFVTPFGEESAPSPASALTTGKIDGIWALSALNAAPINSASITGAAYASGVVTVATSSTKHLRAYEEVTIAGVVGMTDLNANHVITEIVDATHFKVALTTAQTYTSGGTWIRVAPHNTTGMTRRIYRSLNGSYFFCTELAIATTSWTDTVADADLGESLATIGHHMPPATLKGLVAHPNGFMIGFDGNTMRCSESWRPYAWPTEYDESFNFDVVAIGVFGGNIAVGTKGFPSVVTGSHPSAFSIEKIEVLEPCVSKQSMVDIGSGVVYASTNGLVLCSNGGARLVTESIFSKNEWALLSPSSMRCEFHSGLIFGSHIADDGQRTGFTFDIGSGAFSQTSNSDTASFVDPETNNRYIVQDGVLYQWDAHPYNDISFDWKSKVYALPRPVNFGAGIVDAELGVLSNVNAAIAADLAWNTAALAAGVTHGELGGSMLGEYTLGGSLLRGGTLVEYTSQYLRLTVYGDGVERYTENVLTGKSFSMPSGYKAKLWEFRLSGNIPVYSLAVAENAQGLRQLA